MTLVAWYPSAMMASPELTAVMIKPGVVTHSDWIDALADRVTGMAQAAENPQKAVECACRYLEIPACQSDPSQAGQFLVSANWRLIDNLGYLHEGAPYPFPAMVTASDEDAIYAIDNCDFEYWVGLAYEKL